MSRRTRPAGKLVSTLTASALVVLAPGLDLYRAWGQSALRPGTPVTAAPSVQGPLGGLQNGAGFGSGLEAQSPLSLGAESGSISAVPTVAPHGLNGLAAPAGSASTAVRSKRSKEDPIGGLHPRKYDPAYREAQDEKAAEEEPSVERYRDPVREMLDEMRYSKSLEGDEVSIRRVMDLFRPRAADPALAVRPEAAAAAAPKVLPSRELPPSGTPRAGPDSASDVPVPASAAESARPDYAWLAAMGVSISIGAAVAVAGAAVVTPWIAVPAAAVVSAVGMGMMMDGGSPITGLAGLAAYSAAPAAASFFLYKGAAALIPALAAVNPVAAGIVVGIPAAAASFYALHRGLAALARRAIRENAERMRRGSSTGVAPQPGSTRDVLVTWAKRIGVALLLIGAVAVAWAPLGFMLADLVREANEALRHWTPFDPFTGGTVGASMAGFGGMLGFVPPSLPNPADRYAEAMKLARDAAGAEVAFVGVNGVMARRTLAMDYEFAAEGRSVLVRYSAGVAGGLSYDKTVTVSQAGLVSRALEPYLVSMGSKLSPDAALASARNALPGFESDTFAFRLHTEAVSGDTDLAYTFYAANGSEVRVNARTGAAAVLKGAPLPKTIALERGYTGMEKTGVEAQADSSGYKYRPEDAIVYRKVQTAVDSMLDGFVRQNSGWINRVLGKEQMVQRIADAFRRELNEGRKPAFEVYKDEEGGRRYLRGPNGESISELLWKSLSVHYGLTDAELSRYLEIQRGLRDSSGRAAMDAAGWFVAKVDGLKGFRHAINALHARVTLRLQGDSVEAIAAGIRAEIADLKKFFDVTPEDPAAVPVLKDLQSFLSLADELFLRLSVGADADTYKALVYHHMRDLQFVAESSATYEELQRRLAESMGRPAPRGPSTGAVSEPGRGPVMRVLSAIAYVVSLPVRAAFIGVQLTQRATGLPVGWAGFVNGMVGLVLAAALGAYGAPLYLSLPTLLLAGLSMEGGRSLQLRADEDAARARLVRAIERHWTRLMSVSGVVHVRPSTSRLAVTVEVAHLTASTKDQIGSTIEGFPVRIQLVRPSTGVAPMSSPAMGRVLAARAAVGLAAGVLGGVYFPAMAAKLLVMPLGAGIAAVAGVYVGGLAGKHLSADRNGWIVGGLVGAAVGAVAGALGGWFAGAALGAVLTGVSPLVAAAVLGAVGAAGSAATAYFSSRRYDVSSTSAVSESEDLRYARELVSELRGANDVDYSETVSRKLVALARSTKDKRAVAHIVEGLAADFRYANNADYAETAARNLVKASAEAGTRLRRVALDAMLGDLRGANNVDYSETLIRIVEEFVADTAERKAAVERILADVRAARNVAYSETAAAAATRIAAAGDASVRKAAIRLLMAEVRAVGSVDYSEYLLSLVERLRAMDAPGKGPSTGVLGYSSPLGAALAGMRRDARRGWGPGRYALRGVRRIEIEAGPDLLSLPTLRVNGREAGKLLKYAGFDARRLAGELAASGRAAAYELAGTYGEGNFYVESIRLKAGPASGPATAAVSEKSGSGVEVVGKLVAYALAAAPAVWAFLALGATPVVLALAAQALPLVLLASVPDTARRPLLMLPGVLSVALAAAVAPANLLLAGVLLVNGAGLVHYGYRTTKHDQRDGVYGEHERGLVAFFSGLANYAGAAGAVVLAGAAGLASLAGPAVAFIVIALNGGFNFNIRFFQDWARGFALGFARAGASVVMNRQGWWKEALKGKEGRHYFTDLFGYAPAGVVAGVEWALTFVAGLATALLFGLVKGVEEAVGGLAPQSWPHRFLNTFAETSADTMLALMRGGVHAQVMGGARKMLTSGVALVAPFAFVAVGLAKTVEAVAWAVSLVVSAVAGLVAAVVSPREKTETPEEPSAPPSRSVEPGGRSAVSIAGSWVALALSAVPGILAALIASTPWLAAGLAVTSFGMAAMAGMPNKDGRHYDVLKVVMALAMGAALLKGGHLILAALAAANVVGYAHLALTRKADADHEDAQAQLGATWFASALLASAPVLGVLGFWYALAAAAVSTGILGVMGAFKFKHPFFDGLTEGLGDGITEAVGAGIQRAAWWFDHLKFWKGKTWVSMLGALPVFALVAFDGAAGFVLGLAAALVWSPLRGLEKGFESAWNGGLPHRLLKGFNGNLSGVTKLIAESVSEPVFDGVRWLFARPNLLTVPAGLVLLKVGQVLQLFGTALGVGFGVVIGVFSGPEKKAPASTGVMPRRWQPVIDRARPVEKVSVAVPGMLAMSLALPPMAAVFLSAYVLFSVIVLPRWSRAEDAQEIAGHGYHMVGTALAALAGTAVLLFFAHPMAMPAVVAAASAGTLVMGAVALAVAHRLLDPERAASALRVMLANDPNVVSVAGRKISQERWSSPYVVVAVKDDSWDATRTIPTRHRGVLVIVRKAGETKDLDRAAAAPAPAEGTSMRPVVLRTALGLTLAAAVFAVQALQGPAVLVFGLMLASLTSLVWAGHHQDRVQAARRDAAIAPHRAALMAIPGVVGLRWQGQSGRMVAPALLVVEVTHYDETNRDLIPLKVAGYQVLVSVVGRGPSAGPSTGAVSPLRNDRGQLLISIPLLILAVLGGAAALSWWFASPWAVALGAINLVTIVGAFAAAETLGHEAKGLGPNGFVLLITAAVVAMNLVAAKFVAIPLVAMLALGILPALALYGGLALDGGRSPLGENQTLKLLTLYGFLAAIAQSVGVVAYGFLQAVKHLAGLI